MLFNHQKQTFWSHIDYDEDISCGNAIEAINIWTINFQNQPTILSLRFKTSIILVAGSIQMVGLEKK